LAEIPAVEHRSFSDTLKWVSVFTLTVNEQNAAFNRVVTAPTNGSAGVIPAILMYALNFHHPAKRLARERLMHSLGLSASDAFLLIARTIGGLFKQKATISATIGAVKQKLACLTPWQRRR
jgi:L-serine dehydratase